MQISVVIPCFNANATLGLQLEALSRQIDAPDFEVIVVDNLSTDPPDGVVAAWSDRIENLRIVRATQAKGTSHARNVGTKQARTELIAHCDADDVAGPSFVRAAYEGLRQADVVTGAVTPVDAEEFDAGIDHVWEVLGVVEDPYLPLDFAARDLDPDYPILMGGACALRREVVEALDGWDQAYFPGAEDNDFGLRASKAGFRMGKSWGMTLAERRRATGAQAFRRAYDGGLMHMKLCAGHDLWGTSPHLHDPVWWADLAKLPVAAVRMAFDRSGRRDLLGLGGRFGLRSGQAVGYVRYRVCRKPVVAQLGLGLRADV